MDDQEEIIRRGMEIMAETADFWNARIDDFNHRTAFDIEFVKIDEEFLAKRNDEVDVNDRWAHGWTNEDGFFKRQDSMEFSTEVQHRIFPTRYRLKDFRLSKSLRRVLKRNSDARVVIQSLKVTPEKSILFEKHNLRLNDSLWLPLQAKFRSAYLTRTHLTEFSVYLGEKLVACSILEEAERSVSSLLAFWDTDYYERSLGILTVLLEMQYARDEGFEYYYLTSYLKQHSNYQYALRFPALEFYDWDNDRWLAAKTPEADALLDQKLDFYYEKFDNDLYECFFEIVPEHNADIVGLAIIGSQTNKEAKNTDYRLIILTNNAEKYINDETLDLARSFGYVREHRFEDRGATKTLRVFYKNGNEFEFNFVEPTWASINPIGENTRSIVKDGMKIIYDSQGILEKLQKAVLET